MSSLGVDLAGSQARPAVTAQPARTAVRFFFIDNIRVFLTVLVMLHHLMIIYAGSGSWIYNERRQDDITAGLGGWFCAINQAYFMGLFLFISAYFVPGSYDRKGPGNFMKDRLIRLGIPLVVYGWVIRPVMIYAGFSRAGELRMPFGDWFTGVYFRENGIIGGGPLWFIETLLVFSAVYVLWRLLRGARPVEPARQIPFPGLGAMALFALLLGVATFVARIVFPVGSSFKPLNLQLGNFAQYIALFILGLVGYRSNWLAALPVRTGRIAWWASLALIVLYPVIAVLSGATENPEPFMGGWGWQSFLYSAWESFMCVAMCTGLLYLFRERWNFQGALARLLARHAYAAYLIHEPLITVLAVLAGGIVLYPLLKFAVSSLLFIPLTFALSILVLKIPGADRVL